MAEYVHLVEGHAETHAHPASVRTLPYPKQTIKAAIVTCARTLQRTGQLTSELRELLEGAYVSLADYVDDELARVMVEYREAGIAVAGMAAARDRVQTAAWQTLAGTGQLAGDIARTIAEDAAALRVEFEERMAEIADYRLT